MATIRKCATVVGNQMVTVRYMTVIVVFKMVIVGCKMTILG